MSRIYSVLALAVVLASGAAPASAQPALEGQVLDLVTEVRDLHFAVEDLGGGVENLQVTETETEIKIELSGDVLFDFDMASIRKEAEPVLKDVAGVLNKFPKAAVMIAGYTDAKGADSYNLKLSQRRAASVKAWLIKNGDVQGRRLSTKGFGEVNPVAPNSNPDGSDNPQGRQKNRRVEITVRK